VSKRYAIAFAAILLTGSLHAGDAPKGWFPAGSSPDSYDMGVQPGDRRAGDRNAYIRAQAQHRGFGTLMQTFSADAYRGKRLRLSGFLRTRDANSAAMWMRIDGQGQQTVGFDNMSNRPLRGDTDWKRYDIVLDVPDSAQVIAFGFLLEGKGEVLADDFHIEPVGKNVAVTGTDRPAPPAAPANLDFTQ